LDVNLAAALKSSAKSLECCPLARHHLSNGALRVYSIYATFFIGSILERRVLVHERSSNRRDQYGDT